ncbi:fumarylacetoacetate hydrolase family protein [Aquibacillus koreensis]|uniref:Fumarylacetoacetate hydrolase family protein n=1 Tax=Aquibacillus koreensis TaxID=279446 RepID=A0A9X3WP70_9BACI|nr:fumarylacetoacetate hydrolase family protein [Aquibacillus koreensis]MCT2537008.1 fumarylacetoacetate hydrolase family protein [Aquibacillus koreensis]MDC3422338.1 fumarylacetoacetate hydrolase family protein [Aquibacillus koreensis]
MRVICYQSGEGPNQLAAVTDEGMVYDLPFIDFISFMRTAEQNKKSCLAIVNEIMQDSLPIPEKMEDLTLKLPVRSYEVWAAGVTYSRSRDARNMEAKVTTNSYYDKVYDAKRPELFLKSTERRTIGPNTPVYIRSDSNWQIPEPELGLVIDSHGAIIGYTIGNDMSSRDIEGENPLYLPQAKVWKHSCSIGPAIRLAETVEDPYSFVITCRIFREGKKVFQDSASTALLKRKYEELVSYLIKDNVTFDGTILLTGTCIVPDDDFTLQDGDMVEIEIPGIGTLTNPVKAPLQENEQVKANLEEV